MPLRMACRKLQFICCFLTVFIHTYAHSDDDFAFEHDIKPRKSNINTDLPVVAVVPVQRLWGIPDTQAVVGTLFVLNIPKDAFSGDVEYYEAVSQGIHPWPSWLELNNKDKTLKGVPTSKDLGEHYLIIRAVGPQSLHKAKDVFSVEVIKPSFDQNPQQKESHPECTNKDPVMLSVLMDTTLDLISPQQRITIIENMAGFFGLPTGIFYLHEHNSPSDMLSDSTFFMAGSGNVKKGVKNSQFAALSWQVGCGDKIWNEYTSVIQRVKHQAKDGTLAEVLQESVIGWHAKNEFPVFFRDRRQVGSGDFYDDDLEDEEDYAEAITTSPSHRHRHHHGTGDKEYHEGDEFDSNNVLLPSEIMYPVPSSPVMHNFENIISTPVLIPERPTLVLETTSATTVQPTHVVEQSQTVTSATTSDLVTDESEEDRNQQVTVPLLVSSTEDNYTDAISESTSNSYSPSSHTTDQLTDFFTTDTDKMFTNTSYSTVTSSTYKTTEEMEPETRNFKPTIHHRLKKIPATAGKVLRYKIPEDTFADIEDGSTSNLQISFKTIEGRPIDRLSWFKYNPRTLEIIALPLEEHVSKWEFEIEAKDKDGDSVTDILEVLVQHHKSFRAVNHEFSLHLSIDRSHGLMSPLEWELRVIDALIHLYGDPDASHIIVRAIAQNSDPVVFSWTNDTLPKAYCPREDIDRLLKVISLDGSYPLESLKEALGPGITARRVSSQGYGQCETKHETPVPPAQIPRQNTAPVPRNQIDQINATAGQLLVFTVPEDSFFDAEDGSARNLKMSLLNMDRSPLSSTHWLQFDSKNQEFYGVPMNEDVSRQEYQLVCEDSEGLTANDGLVVVVFPKAIMPYNVEFNIAVDVPYSQFATSAATKRKFFDKLKELYGDPDTSAIVLGSIKPGSTIITWYNRTLPTEECPEEEILHLREVLMNEDEITSNRLIEVMGKDFPVISAGIEAAGVCLGELTVVHKTEVPQPSDDEAPMVEPSDDYLITFVIPAVIIAVMLILAGLIACLFYRRRRSNKMSIGDEDERQSFRNKGIPVIFQDELEEKPEPENKCPVIMKEEKPPLPPPEYQRAYDAKHEQTLNEDTPYHPPPPFTSSRDSGRNTRPKPTPTYRKPPPYVPP